MSNASSVFERNPANWRNVLKSCLNSWFSVSVLHLHSYDLPPAPTTPTAPTTVLYVVLPSTVRQRITASTSQLGLVDLQFVCLNCAHAVGYYGKLLQAM